MQWTLQAVPLASGPAAPIGWRLAAACEPKLSPAARRTLASRTLPMCMHAWGVALPPAASMAPAAPTAIHAGCVTGDGCRNAECHTQCQRWHVLKAHFRCWQARKRALVLQIHMNHFFFLDTFVLAMAAMRILVLVWYRPQLLELLKAMSLG